MKQIEDFEIPARRYIADFGMNPDEMEQFPHPEGKAVMLRRPAWRNVAEVMRDLDAMLEAMGR